ncbi:PREDICTED: serine/threonine-protein kinase 3-like [Amphimedon queenslandica]|uniref:non-specific serine/threonine protein kinase n=1 Tax=Amphimedon queenslandica TaxID=400682 RepID=A0A1X7V7X3_AMPQE|nr:PREDICTED: serine/threonine-protein kinase 3-like [Amphimedon queenslandica]|eukprot:XP_003385366.1 PREDICTED: serine/threonine-protein kinase 3-like [Amphimedon queenslandica]
MESHQKKLLKLSEESLMKEPEDVFDLLEKIGEGAYGAVYKALHKESGQLLAIKQVPVDADLQDIIKEISIMQQCDSQYVVKYYGSYFKNTDLWIVMEYCGAGSVSDIMRIIERPLNEKEISVIVQYALKGLEYLHFKRKIHRDIKAGNILLNLDGHAKLADFGVAGQLTDTMAKRNTVIGTPFWMAPEVIQEVGYDCLADIWSMGITAIEMAEGRPPYAEVHPMRAIFMIPTKPPPTLKQADNFSNEFSDFISRCLVKSPEERPSATSLLQHRFVKGNKSIDIVKELVQLAMAKLEEEEEEEEEGDEDDEFVTASNTMIQRGYPDSIIINEPTVSDLGTLVIVDDDEGDSTMKRVDTDKDSKEPYKPHFMHHFNKEPDHNKKQGNKKNAHVGPQSIYAYFPAIPEGTEFKDYLKGLNDDELEEHMTLLDKRMDEELEALRKRYHQKRQPILQAIDAKKKQQFR